VLGEKIATSSYSTYVRPTHGHDLASAYNAETGGGSRGRWTCRRGPPPRGAAPRVSMASLVLPATDQTESWTRRQIAWYTKAKVIADVGTHIASVTLA
jgi:hypothetical protein